MAHFLSCRDTHGSPDGSLALKVSCDSFLCVINSLGNVVD